MQEKADIIGAPLPSRSKLAEANVQVQFGMTHLCCYVMMPHDGCTAQDCSMAVDMCERNPAVQGIGVEDGMRSNSPLKYDVHRSVAYLVDADRVRSARNE